jgi:predicted TIM-barrel fold metal-dependent hydrolase
MSVIDANALIGRWPIGRLTFKTAADLLKRMNALSIDKALVYEASALKHTPLDGNITLMSSIADYRDRLIPCWVVLPTWKIETGRELIDDLRDNQVKAVRVFSKEHNFTLDEWLCGPMFTQLETARIPLLVDGSEISPSQIHGICKSHPELPLILTQSEYFFNRNYYALFDLHPNFYLEVSTYFVYYGLEDLTNRFGASRLIFGSRMPFQEGGATLGMVKFADLSQDKQDLVLGKNLERLLGGVNL